MGAPYKIICKGGSGYFISRARCYKYKATGGLHLFVDEKSGTIKEGKHTKKRFNIVKSGYEFIEPSEFGMRITKDLREKAIYKGSTAITTKTIRAINNDDRWHLDLLVINDHFVTNCSSWADHFSVTYYKREK